MKSTQMNESRQIEARLARLEPGQSPRVLIKLMYDVLGAVASGSLSDPAAAAATVIEALGRENFFAPGGRFYRYEIEPAATAPDVEADFADDPSTGDSDEDARKKVFKRAAQMAESFPVDTNALDFLFAHRRDKVVSRGAWEKEVRTSFFLEQVSPKLPGYKLTDLIDPDARKSVTETLQASGGTVLLVFHGGFLQKARKAFALIYPETMGEGVMVAGGGKLRSKDGEQRAEADPRKALFMALKALQNGENMFIGPDGPAGRQTSNLNVLGTRSPAGEGAAFLAYASKCKTGWYWIRREQDRFIPVVEPGPSPEDKEPYKDFQDRLYDFYARKIEELLTGDPRNIALRPRWTRVFANAKA